MFKWKVSAVAKHCLCSRQAVYDAIERGELHPVPNTKPLRIMADEAFERFKKRNRRRNGVTW